MLSFVLAHPASSLPSILPHQPHGDTGDRSDPAHWQPSPTTSPLQSCAVGPDPPSFCCPAASAKPQPPISPPPREGGRRINGRMAGWDMSKECEGQVLPTCRMCWATHRDYTSISAQCVRTSPFRRRCSPTTCLMQINWLEVPIYLPGCGWLLPRAEYGVPSTEYSALTGGSMPMFRASADRMAWRHSSGVRQCFWKTSREHVHIEHREVPSTSHHEAWNIDLPVSVTQHCLGHCRLDRRCLPASALAHLFKLRPVSRVSASRRTG